MALSTAQKIEKIRLLEAKIELRKSTVAQRVYDSLYGWQHKFNTATKDHDACMLMASNQSGKSRTGTCLDAIHLTGDYPEDWEGYEFEFPPLCWLLGYSGEKTRDLLQYKLFGRYSDGKFSGGLIPPEKIIDHIAMTGTSGAMREVRVKHTMGISVCQFWSYSQGQHALMGDVVDWYHIDEEPKDPMIYPQVLTRTINGDQGRGGRGILTFTPENGKTQLVCQFMGEDYDGEEDVEIDVSGMYLQGATWDECPHMTPDKQKKMLAKFPAYQRLMRSKGVPLMGAGLIYEVDEDELKVQPRDIPDHWFVINGIDFGWDHPQAHIQLVENRQTGEFIVVNATKFSKTQPFEAWHRVKVWAENVPTAWPGDGLQHKQQAQGEAIKLKQLYDDEGFNLLPDRATFEDGGDGVWVGIMEIINLMQTGRFKIVSSLHEVFEEIRQYHTKVIPAGKEGAGKADIVKVKDDLLDAIRYAYMMRRYAIRICDLYPDPQAFIPKKQGRDKRTGY
jgi:phage terminase large subunit-like protein